MKRRKFLETALASSLALTGTAVGASSRHAGPVINHPEMEARSSLKALHDLCHKQLFRDYLPFWENGGHDAQHGGFMCYLREDGTVEDDRKDIWYQGRGIWVYSYLFNEIDKDLKWLERARLARNFMVRHMHNGSDRKFNFNRSVRNERLILQKVKAAILASVRSLLPCKGQPYICCLIWRTLYGIWLP